MFLSMWASVPGLIALKTASAHTAVSTGRKKPKEAVLPPTTSSIKKRNLSLNSHLSSLARTGPNAHPGANHCQKKMGLLGLLWINCNSIPEASYYPDKRRLYCLLNEWRTTTNRKGYTYPSNMPIIALWQFNSLTREMQSSIIKSKYKRLTKY